MPEDVVLKIERWKYDRLLKTIESFRAGIRLLKMNDNYKKMLMEDLHRMEGILKSGENHAVRKL